MTRRLLAGAIAVSGGVLLLACITAAFNGATAPAAEGQEPSAKDVFGPTRVWTIHLEIPPAESKAMQPAVGFGPPGGPGAPPQPRENKERRDSERNLFGTEFPWVQADFTADGKTYKKVGLRYAGDMTY